MASVNVILPKNRTTGLVKITINFTNQNAKTNQTQIYGRIQGQSGT